MQARTLADVPCGDLSWREMSYASRAQKDVMRHRKSQDDTKDSKQGTGEQKRSAIWMFTKRSAEHKQRQQAETKTKKVGCNWTGTEVQYL